VRVRVRIRCRVRVTLWFLVIFGRGLDCSRRRSAGLLVFGLMSLAACSGVKKMHPNFFTPFGFVFDLDFWSSYVTLTLYTRSVVFAFAFLCRRRRRCIFRCLCLVVVLCLSSLFLLSNFISVCSLS
jgi:hypothetical protein